MSRWFLLCGCCQDSTTLAARSTADACKDVVHAMNSRVQPLLSLTCSIRTGPLLVWLAEQAGPAVVLQLSSFNLSCWLAVLLLLQVQDPAVQLRCQPNQRIAAAVGSNQHRYPHSCTAAGHRGWTCRGSFGCFGGSPHGCR